jgi:uncharacterized protein (TIGR01244 family)
MHRQWPGRRTALRERRESVSLALFDGRRAAMKFSFRSAACCFALALLCAVALPLRAREGAREEARGVSPENVKGVVHFRHIGTTIACAGATSPAALAGIKKMGFVSDINLRLASEPGANVRAEAAEAKAVGLRYYHIPFDDHHPSDAAVDRFLRVITAPGVQPAYIHCSGGNRASTMWFIKLMVVDHWSVDRAFQEATALGMNNPAMKTFGVEYARTHKAPKPRA